MKNKKRHLILSLVACTVLQSQAQVYNEMDAYGNITQRDEYGAFNPNKRDSTKNNKQVPKGVWAWTVDRKFGRRLHKRTQRIRIARRRTKKV